MRIHILFAQRHEEYPGQHAPEALACMTEWDHDDNPDYLNDELKKAQDNTEEFEAARIVTLAVSQKLIMEILRPEPAVVAAGVVGGME